MKKARKVRINGEDWKYFVDRGAVDEDRRPVCRVILYSGDRKSMHHWDLPSFDVKVVSAPAVKEAWKSGKFTAHFRLG